MLAIKDDEERSLADASRDVQTAHAAHVACPVGTENRGPLSALDVRRVCSFDSQEVRVTHLLIGTCTL